MIFKNNVGCDGLITFWSISDHSCFTPSLQPIIHHLYNQIFLGTKLLFQSGAETVISKWVNVFFKVGQKLFQNGAVV